jgi:DNA repair protein RecN (Recombination protein N)
LRAAREIEPLTAASPNGCKSCKAPSTKSKTPPAEARRYADSLDADPLRLEEIETRLHRLTRLKRKYGDSIEQVLAYRAEIEEELARLNVSEEELTGLRAANEAQRRKFWLLPKNCRKRGVLSRNVLKLKS